MSEKSIFDGVKKPIKKPDKILFSLNEYERKKYFRKKQEKIWKQSISKEEILLNIFGINK